ncbi:Zn(II)2Cys6 transcription factor domain-containing protein [Aspergillus lucknowensis]|uniref:Zn(2)-C6 fungal-type domain-containing protein n=1 Tax=Aspergillus lucknowensis TaxID=176173 RepID=A0ABR4LEE2_9EURO
MSACPDRIKTCQTCATAKIRCLRSSGSPICDRCLRLNKSCYFRPARLRQTWVKKEGRLETLERRVNELLGQSQEKHHHHDRNGPTKATGDVIDRGLLTMDDAAVLLDSFLRLMMPHFPFVALPPQTTAAELRQQKPFLFLAILSVSVTRDRALQRVLGEEMKDALARRTVIAYSRPTLETLQGVLVTLAWSQHRYPQRAPPDDFSNYLHLAIGLAVEMELDRPVELRKRCPRMTVNPVTADTQPLAILRAQKRAVIGCSVLSSCFSIITQKTCTFPWSSRLEAFAVELAENPEFASDQCLVHLVRLQHIFEQIDHLSAEPNFPERGSTGEIDNINTLLHGFGTIQAQLQEYTSQLCPQFTNNNYLLASQLHTVDLYLCQVALFERQSTNQLPAGTRIDVLCQGLVAAKRAFDSLLSTPPNTERHISYSEWLQTGFNVILSCKLALMASSDESVYRSQPRVQSLSETLDMPQVLRMCVARQLSRRPDEEPRRTGFDYTGWLQWVQEWFEKRHYASISREKGSGEATVAESATSSVCHTHQSQYFGAVDGSIQPLYVPHTTGDMHSWPFFPDILPTDNLLSGWMDLGVMSL